MCSRSMVRMASAKLISLTGGGLEGTGRKSFETRGEKSKLKETGFRFKMEHKSSRARVGKLAGFAF